MIQKNIKRILLRDDYIPLRVRFWERVNDIELVRKIKYWYWDKIPHRWRPGQILYRIKCFLFKRYTTIKSRHLDHTWYDATGLLPYTIFEILARFLENECDYGKSTFPGDTVEWYDSHLMVKINDKDKYIIDEMVELHLYWENYATGRIHNLVRDEYHKFNEEHAIKGEDDEWMWNPRYKTQEEEELADELFKKSIEEDRRIEKELEDNLIRLIKIKDYMWT